MVPETFADGIGSIGLSNGMIRIDFVTLPPGGGNEGDDRGAEVRYRVVMTPQAFLRTVAVQQRLIAKLEDAGLVRQIPERDDPDESSDGAVAADAVAGTPRSPNFHSD